MKRKTPPRVARWLLEHWTLGADREALGGDLVEEFRAGRSVAWYWRQTLAAVLVGFVRELRERRMVVAYSLLYCAPMPWLWLRGVRHAAQADWMGRIWAMPWPWSTIWATALGLGPEILAVWMGVAIYLLLHFAIERRRQRLRIGRGLWVSALVWWVLMTAAFLAPVSGGINTSTATVAMLLRDPVFLLMKAPQFLAVIVGIWAAIPPEERRRAASAV